MTKYYEKNPMMIGRRIADEYILVPVTHNIGDLALMYTLNVVGACIWELLDGSGKTVDEIVSAVTSEFEVETPQAKADVEEFLAQMQEIGAVTTGKEAS
jgi:hypothetical protein